MRIAILSDIHANAFALEAVLKHAREQSVDAYWFLGDGVGYGPDPATALEFVQSLPSEHWLPGNHDAGLLGHLTPYAFNELAWQALQINRAELEQKRPELLSWFEKEFPPQGQWMRQHSLDGNLLVLVHAALWRANGPIDHLMLYVKPWLRYVIYQELTTLTQLRGESTERAILLSGHTHIPNFCYWDERADSSPPDYGIHHVLIRWGETQPLPAHPTLINPGSVGQPRDGDPRASYAVLDTDAKTIAFHRVTYPVRNTQRVMARLGFPTFLRERLRRANRPDDWPVGWGEC